MERKAASSMMLGMLLVGILALSLNVAVLNPVQADSLDLTDFELEKSEEWPDAVVNSVFCSDVDIDGDVEVVTGGTDLRIWNWNGTTLTLETSTAIAVNSVFCSNVDKDSYVEIVTGGAVALSVYRWNGVTLTREVTTHTIALDSVFCGDVDGDGQVEIVGGGVGGFFVWRWSGLALTEETSTTTSATSIYCSDVDMDGYVEIVGSASNELRVWRWSGTKLTLEASAVVGGISPSYMNSVFVRDVDADGDVEIVTGGYLRHFLEPGQPYYCELRVWNSNGTALTLETYKKWGSPMHHSSDDAYVRSVYCGNADNDADTEIVTGGWLDGEGPLRSWSIKQSSIILENYMNWNAEVRSVFMGDVDGDEQTEIITGGNADTPAQLRIWSVRPNLSLQGTLLETSEEWVEGAGSTYVESVCSDDVDGDGIAEIVGAGYHHYEGDGQGELWIWNWDGTTLTLEVKQEWSARGVYSVFIADVDDDGAKEIVTGGYDYDGARNNGQLRIWTWNGATLTLEKEQEWYLTSDTFVYSVFADDVDGDETSEIVTCGYAHDGTRYNAQLRIWNWNGITLVLPKSQEWYLTSDTYAYSVCAGDVDGDGDAEIITGGSAAGESQLRVWRWDTTTLTLETSMEWLTQLSTEVSSVCTGDVDGDGDIEIVTGGVVTDGTYKNSQIRVWCWLETTLTLEASREWATSGQTEVSSVCSSDVDSDSETEIICAGTASNVSDLNGQFRTWCWNGATLGLEVSQEWGTTLYSTNVNSVWSDDVDGDGVIEIMTGGTRGGTAQLRIWHVVRLDVAVTSVVTSKTVLGQGYSMSINVTVENLGNVATGSFLVTTYYGSVPIGTLPVGNIPLGGSTELTFLWDETAIPYGDYIISAYAIANGDLHDADNYLSDGTVRVTIPCDVNGEGKVDVYDLFEMGKAYGATPAMPNWNPNCDLYEDGMIYTPELSDLSNNYGNFLPVG